MPLRLVLDDDGRTVRFPVPPRESVLIGSGEGCDLRLGDPTVSRRHARLAWSDGRLELEDLGSRNGTRVAGRRLRGKRTVGAGTDLALGTVEGRLEEVEDGDLEPAVRFAGGTADEASPPAGPSPTTAAVGSLHTFALGHLPDWLACLEEGAAPGVAARRCGAALFDVLPCRGVEIRAAAVPGDGDEGGVLFAAEHAEAASVDPAPVVSAGAAVVVRVDFLHAAQAAAYRSLVDAARRLVDLAAGRRPPPDVPRDDEAPPPMPEPPSVEPVVRAVYHDAARVARGDVSVLITGASGTGKELLARYVHRASPRRERDFVALNCAALPRDLLEAELFGVEQGVATGVAPRPGRFELADRGTLFLDEIGDMAAETQAKILRVLQEGEVYRLGARQPRPARVRVVAATNRDLDHLMAVGDFRQDLYHRIADWRVTLPPLAHRPGDVPNLAAHFLEREAERAGVRLAGISRAAMDVLLAFDWPGNVRQLEREMARVALFLEDGELLQRRHLQPAIRDGAAPAPRTLRQRLERCERRELASGIARHQGNLSAVARELEIGRTTLYRRLKELEIEVDREGE